MSGQCFDSSHWLGKSFRTASVAQVFYIVNVQIRGLARPARKRPICARHAAEVRPHLPCTRDEPYWSGLGGTQAARAVPRAGRLLRREAATARYGGRLVQAIFFMK